MVKIMTRETVRKYNVAQSTTQAQKVPAISGE